MSTATITVPLTVRLGFSTYKISPSPVQESSNLVLYLLPSKFAINQTPQYIGAFESINAIRNELRARHPRVQNIVWIESVRRADGRI